MVAGPLPLDLIAGARRAVDSPGQSGALKRMQRPWSNAVGLRGAGVCVSLGTDCFFGQEPGWPDLTSRGEAVVAYGAGRRPKLLSS